MAPPRFADIHCHLCAGLDDGPATMDEAVEMCRMAWLSGTWHIACVAHQGPQWPEVDRKAIAASCVELQKQLKEQEIGIEVVPMGEVMIDVDLIDRLDQGELMTVGDAGQYLLIEMPHNSYFDITMLVQQCAQRSVRPILAHAERYSQLLMSHGDIEHLISLGVVIQVNANSVLKLRGATLRALRAWFQRGIVHVIGSDGHGALRRRPIVAEAFDRVVDWTSFDVANELFYENSARMLSGQRVKLPVPARPKKRFWFL